ncbi:hypothetical protein EK904_014017 [Melospiza melodia maxima]|nr:hypothetical protein EK904_014017 [Melospiza melodia maxima]
MAELLGKRCDKSRSGKQAGKNELQDRRQTILTKCSQLLTWIALIRKSSFILLSKRKKGENLLQFEVISLKTAEER